MVASVGDLVGRFEAFVGDLVGLFEEAPISLGWALRGRLGRGFFVGVKEHTRVLNFFCGRKGAREGVREKQMSNLPREALEFCRLCVKPKPKPKH